jgi:hypothetical protein
MFFSLKHLASVQHQPICIQSTSSRWMFLPAAACKLSRHVWDSQQALAQRHCSTGCASCRIAEGSSSQASSACSRLCQACFLSFGGALVKQLGWSFGAAALVEL